MKSEMGGKGSGPKPGHKSPWYDRPSKEDGKKGGKDKKGESGDEYPGEDFEDFYDGPLDESLPTTGTGTKEDPIVTSNVDDAARALSEDKYVQLHQPDEVATLLDKLAANVADAKAKGADAPKYNLCNVSVPGTNLFCTENKGLSRVQMPQLAGVPLPGSPADALPRDKDGKVNIGPAFIEHMQKSGIASKVIPDVDASHLRASQNELEGGKVANISNAIESGKFNPADAPPIFTTADNYVIDGHHRWAAVVGAQYALDQHVTFPVQQLDTDIVTALAMATDFAEQMGIPRAEMALRPMALAEIRTALRLARITAVFGGPGSGPRPGHQSSWYRRGSHRPASEMSEAEKLAEINEIRGGFKRSTDKRVAQGMAEVGPDGKIVYKGELAAQRAEIVDQWLNNADPVDDPEILFMGGGPAAGKTTALKSGYVEGAPSVGDPAVGERGDAVLVASDDLKKDEFVGRGPMGDYERLVELGDKQAAAWIHQESSSLGKEIYKAARETSRNIVIDTLANTSVEEMSGKIAEARTAARTVRAVYATTPTEDAVKRAAKRLDETGRGVPEVVVRETHAAISRMLPELSSQFDDVTLVDTSGPFGTPPTLVMTNTLGGTPTIHDEGLWQTFLAKGSGVGAVA
ncbi:MAG TPA: zeta toxin family protein, partial [Acidimicrobiia bacterium]|nr:zeta toxin family protein [Acidimicrobiia bacterium]